MAGVLNRGDLCSGSLFSKAPLSVAMLDRLLSRGFMTAQGEVRSVSYLKEQYLI